MYKIILAIRYLIKQRITYLAVLIVVCCVFMAVVVLTVMTGLVTDFKQKNHNFVGDCVVGTDSLVGFAYYEDLMEKLAAAEFVESVSPVIKNFALLSPKGRDLNVHVEILGIEPVRHSRTTGFGKTLYHRRDDVSKVFEPIYDPNLLGCVLGIDLALSRNANSKYSYETVPANVGFSISCFPLTVKGAPALGGLGEVNTRTFYYSDNSHSGLARVDSSLIYLPFQEAQQLCMAGTDKRASAIHIKFKPNVKMQSGCEQVSSLWENFRQEKAGEKLAYLLDTVSVQSWKEYRRAFIAAMEKEQMVMAVMFAFVGLVIVFIVFVVFYWIISHKSKDIGILKSIGVSSANIIGLFSGFAILVGLLGSCIGMFTGWLFLLKINRIEDLLFERFGFQLWDRTMYAIGEIPNRVEPDVLVITVLAAIAACLAGALIASWQAVRSSPVEILQVSRL